MSIPGPLSRRAIILAPNGRDGPLAAQILKESELPAELCPDIPSVVAQLVKGAGLAIIADEALQTADLRPLAVFLEQQPTWSDFPFLVLTRGGGDPDRNPAAARLTAILGNVTFLERPFRPSTLVGAVQAARRGRSRQYEARARLEELSENEQKLQIALKAGQLGSWTLALHGMALTASESTRAHFGRDPDASFSYDDLRRAVHPDDAERVGIAFDKTLQSGCDCVVEFRNVWPDGSVHWVDLRGRAIWNAAGAIGQLVGVSSDITGRKAAELDRERLLDDLAV